VAVNANNFFAPRIDGDQEPTEIWKMVSGYEGLYEVSSYGRLKSCNKTVKGPHNSTQIRKGRILKLRPSSNGYAMPVLYRNNMFTGFALHRLVITHFKKNTDNKPIINHKNGNKTDNHIGNLEYVTYSENIKHAYDNGLRKSSFSEMIGAKHHAARVIIQLDKSGNFITECPCMSDAAKALSIRAMGIQGVCSGRDKSYKGFKWKYK
jgi:hypothetical protein